MSVIISRALPDVRDGLKPSQRRILVAMNDLGLGPTAGTQQVRRHRRRDDEALPPARRRCPSIRRWCAWPRTGTCAIVLIHAQGNFGSIAGLPPAAMRYTEARLSAVAAEMLADLERDTVDFIDNYDGKYREPLVLPSKFPNLLVNGSDGIAVGMATEIPPHNLARSLRRPDRADRRSRRRPSIELMEHHPRPGLSRPAASSAAGRASSTATAPAAARSRCAPAPTSSRKRGRNQIIINEVPYQQTRNRLAEADRRAGQGRAHQGHLRDPRRIQRPQRRAGPPRHRPQARRRPAPGAQPALPVLAAAEDGQHHPAGPGGRPAADADAQADDRGVPAPPRAGHPPAHRVPAARGEAARPHPRRPAHRHLVAGRGDRDLPRVAEPGRGQGAAARPGSGRRRAASGRSATSHFAALQTRNRRARRATT